jgi:hypothetical protein
MPANESLARKPDNDPTVKIFWTIAIGHLLLWMLVCVFTQPNLPLDMVEMIYWGQQWQWGYHKHPPLPAWTAATVWEFSGNQPWAMYLTAQSTIIVTFWAVWKLAREIVSPWLAICCVTVMEGCYYCNYMVNDINNTIMTRPMWALAILLMYGALTRPRPSQRTIHWCLTGVVIGLGMLCKYYMAVLVIAFLAVPVLIPDTRRFLKTPGPWLMTAIAIGIFSPHLIWMVDNDFITIKYVLNRSSDAAAHSLMGDVLKHITSPISFLLSQAGAVLPVLLLTWPLVKGWRLNIDGKAFERRYLAIVVLGPVMVYLLVSAIWGATIRSMWGGPLFSFLGLFLVVTFFVNHQHGQIRQVVRSSLVVGVVMALALFVRNGFGPAVRGELSKVHFPGAEVTEQLHQRWRQFEDSPLGIVGGQMFVAGCVGVYSSEKIDVFSGLEPLHNPWIADQRMEQSGGMIVWDQDDYGIDPPHDWINRYPNSQVLPPIVCKTRALTGDVNANVGVIIVHPQSAAAAVDEVWVSKVQTHAPSDSTVAR